MSWIRNSTLSLMEILCLRIIGSGHVPKHIAFIMDGNRRYARQHNVNRAVGHSKGFDKLTEVLHWCRELGVKEVTVYAFSIENFKRTQDEVDTLLSLAEQKFQRLLDEREKLMENGVSIRVIGDLSLLPPHLRKLAAEAMLMTRNNDKSILNVAFAYTARDEITNAVGQVVSGVVKKLLSPKDINQDLLTQSMYSRQSSTPELVIRTSGEVRLSDFLLWQISCSCIYFTEVLWPEFSVWHLLSALFYYQRSYKDMKRVSELERKAGQITKGAVFVSGQKDEFIKHLNEEFHEYISQSAAFKVPG